MIEILIYILAFISVCLNVYDAARSRVSRFAQEAVNYAEESKKKGEEKMQNAVDFVKEQIPFFAKFIFSDNKVKSIIQDAFDKMEEYAKKQIGGEKGGS